MKIGEALLIRASYNKRIKKISSRLGEIGQVQEGEELQETPEMLMSELKQNLSDLLNIVKRINKSNLLIKFDEEKSLAEVLIEKENLRTEITAVQTLLNSATGAKEYRYSRSEIRNVVTINILETKKLIDSLSKKYRELDVKIQELNWLNDLAD